jgi:hypothetical protein
LLEKLSNLNTYCQEKKQIKQIQDSMKGNKQQTSKQSTMPEPITQNGK